MLDAVLSDPKGLPRALYTTRPQVVNDRTYADLEQTTGRGWPELRGYLAEITGSLLHLAPNQLRPAFICIYPAAPTVQLGLERAQLGRKGAWGIPAMAGRSSSSKARARVQSGASADCTAASSSSASAAASLSLCMGSSAAAIEMAAEQQED